MSENIWSCKIGSVDGFKLVDGADRPMRFAVEKAYREITGQEPDFFYSGWDITEEADQAEYQGSEE